ncbi:MAG: hypothetical protein LBT66_03695 [Methanobrevibacter sp.]|jgi:hypothetical protein|nr:hypothetical protein [Candidatus Methanovirga meridionalis]
MKKFCINNKYIKLLSLISIFALCFSMISLGSATKSTYYDNPNHSTQNNALNGVQSIVATFAYANPPQIISQNANSMTVRAYPSSYWDDWQFRAYIVTWPKSVRIDQVNGDNYQATTPITTATITFNPKGTAEGELTVNWSADGRHNDCDFSAITGFEKETSWTHLSIWKSRTTYPYAA